MLDVFHYLFEEYFTFTSEEHVGSASGIRKSVWTNFYGVDFLYEIKTRSQEEAEKKARGYSSGQTPSYASEDDFSSLDSVDAFSPRDRSENGEEIKPFIPATNFDPDSSTPFAGLDGPMN